MAATSALFCLCGWGCVCGGSKGGTGRELSGIAVDRRIGLSLNRSCVLQDLIGFFLPWSWLQKPLPCQEKKRSCLPARSKGANSFRLMQNIFLLQNSEREEHGVYLCSSNSDQAKRMAYRTVFLTARWTPPFELMKKENCHSHTRSREQMEVGGISNQFAAWESFRAQCLWLTIRRNRATGRRELAQTNPGPEGA